MVGDWDVQALRSASGHVVAVFEDDQLARLHLREMRDESRYGAALGATGECFFLETLAESDVARAGAPIYRAGEMPQHVSVYRRSATVIRQGFGFRVEDDWNRQVLAWDYHLARAAPEALDGVAIESVRESKSRRYVLARTTTPGLLDAAFMEAVQAAKDDMASQAA